MIARGRVVVEADLDGRSRLVCLRSEGPLVLRPTGSPASAPGVEVHLVGGAGGPLGGDVLTLEIVVGPGAELTLRTVAASVVLPGPTPSVFDIDARVGEGARLWWLPEPTIAVTGCRHETRASVRLDAGARLRWREELIGGRHREEGGSVASRLTIDLDGRPLLRHRVDLGCEHPPWATPAVAGGARCSGSMLAVDPLWDRRPPEPVVIGSGAAAVLPLGGPAVHVVALAADAMTLRRLLDAGEAASHDQPALAR